MKTFCCILLITLVFVGPAAAQGYIGLFSSDWGFDTRLYDVPGLCSVYVIQPHAEGFVGSRWKIEIDPAASLTYLSTTYQSVTAHGDPLGGVVVDYGSCLSGHIHIATINFFCSGTSPPCSWIDIVAHPASQSGSVEVVDCNGYKWFVHCNDNVREMVVNPDENCIEGGPG